MSTDDGWSDYLTDYHRSHAGITERLLTRAVHPDAGTPYEWLRSALPRHPERVIDLACGSAPLYDLLPQTSHYVGLDVSEAELRLAADRERGPLLRADAGSLPIDRGSADAVVCSMAIMLLRPVETVLAEVARVLRPGGLFVTIRPVTWPVRIADVRVTVPLVLGLRHMPEVPQRFSRRRLRLRHTAPAHRRTGRISSWGLEQDHRPGRTAAGKAPQQSPQRAVIGPRPTGQKRG